MITLHLQAHLPPPFMHAQRARDIARAHACNGSNPRSPLRSMCSREQRVIECVHALLNSRRGSQRQRVGELFYYRSLQLFTSITSTVFPLLRPSHFSINDWLCLRALDQNDRSDSTSLSVNNNMYENNIAVSISGDFTIKIWIFIVIMW